MFKCPTEEHLWMIKKDTQRLLTDFRNSEKTVKSLHFGQIEADDPHPGYRSRTEIRRSLIAGRLLPGITYLPQFEAIYPCSHTRFRTFFHYFALLPPYPTGD